MRITIGSGSNIEVDLDTLVGLRSSAEFAAELGEVEAEGSLVGSFTIPQLVGSWIIGLPTGADLIAASADYGFGNGTGLTLRPGRYELRRISE